jgi:hypothetical protein
MKENNRTKNITNEMRECFEEIGFPNLANPDEVKYLNADRSEAGFIVPMKIRFEYDANYYSSAMVNADICESIPNDKVSGLRELLNWVNLDIDICHFSLYAFKNNDICFRTSLYVPGEKLPRDKFKKLLGDFFKNYCQWLPSIYKYLAEGGEPMELVLSNKGNLKKGKPQYTDDDYERVRSDVNEVLARMKLPLKFERDVDGAVVISGVTTIKACRAAVSVSILKERNITLVQMVYNESLTKKRMADAIELALLFDETSYRSHISVHPSGRVGIMAGVIVDPILDKDELEHQINIILSTGILYIPIILGHHNPDVSSRETIIKLIESQQT